MPGIGSQQTPSADLDLSEKPVKASAEAEVSVSMEGEIAAALTIRRAQLQAAGGTLMLLAGSASSLPAIDELSRPDLVTA